MTHKRWRRIEASNVHVVMTSAVEWVHHGRARHPRQQDRLRRETHLLVGLLPPGATLLSDLKAGQLAKGLMRLLPQQCIRCGGLLRFPQSSVFAQIMRPRRPDLG